VSASAVSFFIPEPTPAERKAKARGKAKAAAKVRLTKAEEAAIRGYQHADAPTRKAMLLDQAEKDRKARIIARRKWRKGYMRRYRAMAAMATVII
jgi:hypothetical protein